MRIWLIIVVVFSFFENLSAQCPVVNFNSPSSACINENILVQNTAEASVSYTWDFCSGDLAITPTAQVVADNNFLFRTRAIRIIKHLGNWYGFTIDQANSPYRLIRFNFGASLQNTPVITDLGNPSNALNSAYDFQLYQEGGIWYALIANTGGNNILKYTFGTSPDAIPVVQNLGSLGILNEPNGISLIDDNGTLNAFITNGATSQIVRLNFGSSINNSPTVSSFSIPGASTPRGIALTKECDRWMGLVTSYGNGKVFWIDFNNGLNQPALSGEITFFTSYNFPAGISLVTDGGEYFAFIQSALGELYKLSFGTSILDKSGTGQNLGNFGISNENFAIELIKEQSDWTGFSMDLTNRRLVRYNFPVACSATPAIFNGNSPPPVKYGTSGIKKVSVQALSSTGSLTLLSKDITISSNVAPDINFVSQYNCAGHDINFTSQNISANISQYDWAFGDGGISSLPNPVHQFASAGEFQTTLKVTAANACQNFTTKTISVYNQPVADFNIPSASPLCTNQNFLFENTTADIGYTPMWEWSIDGIPVTTNEDLTYTFTSVTNPQIKLKASIPGCETEKIVNITTLVAGPKPDFTITGVCQQEAIAFSNTSTGSVASYAWDFGDSQTSTQTNPVNVYEDPGFYTVTLTASNAAGCNNSASKQFTIYSTPQVNFAALPPPFSCSGTPAEFSDLTPPPSDSNLSTWLWNFGDTGSASNTSTEQHPQHTYNTASDYTVSLTVTTNFLCSNTIQKAVTIYQSPTASFTHSALCEDAAVTFSDAASTNQAWNWQIGSGFYFTENPEHTFTSPGEYDVTLSVTSSNSCVGTTQQTVVIPAKLLVDFSSLRTCANQNTEFTNLTNDSADPITGILWNFGGTGSAATNPAIVVFPETGTVNVTLTVSTESGCAYPVTKPVTITSGPLAAFTANPNTGQAPLTIQFVNNSLAANTFVWDFGDGAPANSLASPFNTYEISGDYTVHLIARDLQSCVDTTRQLITVLSTAEVNPPSPNPSQGTFTIEWEVNEQTKTFITLIDGMGRQMRNFEVMATAGVNKYILDITGEQRGFYILTIKYLNEVKTYRLMLAE